jgi:hypothetical protein
VNSITDTLIDIAAPPRRATLRASALKVGYLKSMLHMRHYLTAGGSDDTPGMRFGRLVHMAVLEPDKQPAIWTGGRKAGKEYDNWLCEQPEGREQTTTAEWLEAQSCAASVLSNNHAVELLDGTKREMALYSESTQYGKVSARLDAWMPGSLIDLKTTAQVDRRSIERICASMGYHIQFGWYSWLLDALKLDHLPNCYGIFVESKPPYDVAVYPIAKASVMMGIIEAGKIAEKYRACELRREWPGQQTESEPIELPEWAYKNTGDDLEAGDLGEL